MYKVFIENRPVIICEKNTINAETIVLISERVLSFEADVFPFFKKSEPKIPIVLLAKDAHKEFERLFEDYKRIIAAGGIVKKNDQFLFIKRNGKWDIPKGKLDKSENPELGAIREIEEECGIQYPVISSFICCTYHTYRFRDKPRLKLTYWYGLDYNGNDALKPQADEGITKAKWFKIDKIDKIRKNTFVSILDVIDRYFKPEKFKDEGLEFDQ